MYIILHIYIYIYIYILHDHYHIYIPLSICPYHPLLQTGPANYIQFPQRADENQFLLIGQHKQVHV